MTHQDPYHHLPDPVRQEGFYAGVPLKRLFAFLFDVAVIFAFSLLAVLATLGLGAFIFVVIFFVVGFAYRVGTLAGGSATWGMRLMAIEMRRIDAGRFNFSDAFLHTLGFYISMAVFPVQLISVVLMLTTARGQGLTDLLFGSVALNRRAGS